MREGDRDNDDVTFDNGNTSMPAWREEVIYGRLGPSWIEREWSCGSGWGGDGLGCRPSGPIRFIDGFPSGGEQIPAVQHQAREEQQGCDDRHNQCSDHARLIPSSHPLLRKVSTTATALALKVLAPPSRKPSTSPSSTVQVTSATTAPPGCRLRASTTTVGAAHDT